MKQKNIIFYFSDQQRADTINDEVTPNLMKLANEGTLFANTFTCQPVCGPARACLQTGINATENGCYKNDISLPKDIKPLAEYFKESGYQTAYIGKWHLASDSKFNCKSTSIPKDRLGGYEYFRGADILEFTSHGYDGYIFDENGKRIDFQGYRVDRMNDFALEFIQNVKDDKPFFMFVSQLEPHHQNDRHCYEGFKPTVENFSNYPIPEDLKHFKGDYEKHYPNYISAINRIDYNIGKLVECLKQKGIYEDTIIIYTSDHGSHFKTRNLEYKRSCHDSSIHIPLIIKADNFKNGGTCDKLISLLDLPPTLLSMAGIEIPKTYQGFDITSDHVRDNVFVQISESHCGRAIRTEKFKYSMKAANISYIAPTKNSTIYFDDYLYDLEADKNEYNNLINDKNYKEIKLELRNKLIDEMIKAGEKKPRVFKSIISKKK